MHSILQARHKGRETAKKNNSPTIAFIHVQLVKAVVKVVSKCGPSLAFVVSKVGPNLVLVALDENDGCYMCADYGREGTNEEREVHKNGKKHRILAGAF